MPQEETIKYRIQIDSSDLGGQLENIKQQLDTAMGQVAFMKGGKQPEPLDFYKPLQRDMDDVVGPGASANWASKIIQETKKQVDETSSRVFGDLSSFLESSKLGVQKFTTDLQWAGLTSRQDGPISSYIQHQTPYKVPAAITEAGLPTALTAKATGYGWEPQGPLSLTNYQALMQQRASETMKSAIPDVAAGAAIAPFIYRAVSKTGMGRAAALLSTAVGATVGGDMLGDVVENLPFTGDIKETDIMANYIQATTRQNPRGGLSKAESIEAAESIMDLSYGEDKSLGRQGIGGTEIANAISGFTAAGGFAQVANVDQYISEAEDVVRNYTKVMHAMKTTMSTALQTMSDVSMMGGGMGAEAATDFIFRAKGLAGTAALPTGKMLEMASQQAEMVRGTGQDPLDAAYGGMQLATTLRQMIKSGEIGTSTL